MDGRHNTSWKILLLLLTLGGIIGGWIGEAVLRLCPALVMLGKTQSVGLPNFFLDLKVFTLNFSFMLNINFFTIIGFFLAWLLYRKL